MRFEHFKRGYPTTCLLLSGWGFGVSVLSELDLPFDLILPAEPVTGDISEELGVFLDRYGLGPVRILGWSLGAYVALDLYLKLPARVEGLDLIALRRAYPPEFIEWVRGEVKKDRRQTLSYFYRRCFLGHRRHYEFFVAGGHEQEGMQWWTASRLLQALDYMERQRVDLSEFSRVPLRLFHGQKDVVAPLSEAPAPPPGGRIEVFADAGHAAFLAKDFIRGLRETV